MRRDKILELLKLLKVSGRWKKDLVDQLDVKSISSLVSRARRDPRLPRGKTIEAWVETVERWGVTMRMTWYQLVTDYANQEPEQMDLLGEEAA
jgi:hypothetical protein